MKILLVNVDSKIPNIALGRYSTYFKEQGHDVTYLSLGIKGFQSNHRAMVVDAKQYDKVYVSNIFTTSQNKFKIINNNHVKIGGVGSINPHEWQMDEIHNSEIDYSLWPENDISYGFITRGCSRKCKFCFVPKIEGKIRFENSIDKIVRHKKVKFMDNNLLAYPNHMDILRELRDKNINCQFNQGLDLRLVTDENAKLLSELRYMGKYIFAFDDIRLEKVIARGTARMQKYMPQAWKMRFFIYVNADDKLHSLVYRVKWCKNHGVLPYIMRDKNCKTSMYRDFITDCTGWVAGTSGIFCVASFGQYLFHEKKNNPERVAKSLQIYKKALAGEI